VNQVLPIGGPCGGRAYSAKEQAELLFKLTRKEPKYVSVPVALMDGVIGILDFLARFFPQLEVSAWQ
jgi:divinyl chlorophyllide a 8-vinyl-reductase